MLGEAEDCHALGGVLRCFARDARDVAFGSLTFCHVVGDDLLLTAAPGPAGVSRREDAGFVWRVPPDKAAWFADRLDDLGQPGRFAGSEELECGIEDGISVKVSRGEYTEDFLTGGQARPASAG